MDYEVAHHASVVTPNGVVTCGGWASAFEGKKDCFRFTNQNTWKPFPSMNKARAFFDMVVLGDDIVAFGGYNFEDSYEMINWSNGDKWEVTNMNQRFYFPCVTKWNEEGIFITGGFKGRSLVSNANFKSFKSDYQFKFYLVSQN